jgi:23S rRNA pseudouridine2604 synthase
MCSALGYRARRLQRVRIINIELGELALGEWRYLSEAEVAGLLRPEPPVAVASRPRVQGRLLPH